MAFVDEHTDAYGVEPICECVPIAPSTYHERKAEQADPTRRSERAQRDERLKVDIQRVWDEHFFVYGAKKVWLQLGREKIDAARCTVERLMRDMGLRGVTRGGAFRITTKSDDAADRPADLVKRNFTADRPNAL